ncbi:MAG: hypothetical protein GY795_33645 [Desulfobacterales bacterium]|nr:hypothetical protein [Desulfobacterales bacterium]
MKKITIITLVLFGFCLTGNAQVHKASEHTEAKVKTSEHTETKVKTATKEECIAKTKEVAEMINKDGLDAAKAEIGKKDGKFVWKDTYVFLLDFNGKMLAHPVKPALTEKENLLGVTDKNEKNPKKVFVEFIKIAKEKGEGWVDYMWPKPGSETPAVKNTYIYRVPGKELILGAGIYK